MRRFFYLVFFIIAFVLFSGCKKDEKDSNVTPTPVYPALNIKILFEIDGEQLLFDSIKYTNAASYLYSVNSMVFYLSRISLIKPDSQVVSVKDWLYVDALDPQTYELTISSVPEGNYIGMTFNIGLDSVQNVTGGLPATIENLAMEWPVPMGGGYHFLKLEGYFADSGSTPGYAVHLGNNISLCPVKLSGNFCIGSGCSKLTLVLNVNEWFQSPSIYDFNIDGNYTMGNMSVMTKISQNGYNVFAIQ